MANQDRKNELVALIDMDGTLCDYDGAMRRDMAKISTPGEKIDWYGDAPSWMTERKKLIQDQPGWWENLEPLELGMALSDAAEKLGYRRMVLTKGPSSRNHGAWTEKVRWCRSKIPGVPVTITEDKGLVYGKILIDDWPDYVSRWLEWRPRGFVLMPGQPWNEDFRHPNVMRVTSDNLEEAIAEMGMIARLHELT